MDYYGGLCSGEEINSSKVIGGDVYDVRLPDGRQFRGLCVYENPNGRGFALQELLEGEVLPVPADATFFWPPVPFDTVALWIVADDLSPDKEEPSFDTWFLRWLERV